MTDLSAYKNQLDRIELKLLAVEAKLETQERENHTLQLRLEAAERNYKAEKKRANELAKELRGIERNNSELLSRLATETIKSNYLKGQLGA